MIKYLDGQKNTLGRTTFNGSYEQDIIRVSLEPISKMCLEVQCCVAGWLKMYSSSANVLWRTPLFRHPALYPPLLWRACPEPRSAIFEMGSSHNPDTHLIIVIIKNIFLVRTETTSDPSENYFGNHYRNQVNEGAR